MEYYPETLKKAKTNSEWQVKQFGQSSNVDKASILRPKRHTDYESAEKGRDLERVAGWRRQICVANRTS
jgi:hypothetical protein